MARCYQGCTGEHALGSGKPRRGVCSQDSSCAVPGHAGAVAVTKMVSRMISLSSGFSYAGFNRSGGGGYSQNRWGNSSRDNNNSNSRGSYSRAPQQQPPPQQPPPPQPPPQQPPPPPSYSPVRNPPGPSSYSKNSIPGSSASTSTPTISSYSPPQVRGGGQGVANTYEPQVSTPTSNPALYPGQCF